MRTRVTAAVAVALLTTLSWASPALAHAVISPASVPPGVETTFQVQIPHGCAPGEPPPPPGTEVSPTTEVAVEIPDAVTVSFATAPGGWQVDTSGGVISYSGGVLADGDPGAFAFTATVAGAEGDELPFRVFQGCEEGEYRWVGDAGSDTPAPVVTISAGGLATEEPTATEATAEPTATEATDEPTATEAAPATEPTAIDHHGDEAGVAATEISVEEAGTGEGPLVAAVATLGVLLLVGGGALLARTRDGANHH